AEAGRTEPRARAGRAAFAAMRILDARTLGIEGVAAAVDRPPSEIPRDVVGAVESIVADVRARGDAALLEYTARFDGLRVPAALGLALSAADFEAGGGAGGPAGRGGLARPARASRGHHTPPPPPPPPPPPHH